MRSEEDAILDGKNTPIIDNPQLNARCWDLKKNPLRMVIDKNLEIPQTHHLFDNQQPTIVFTQKESTNSKNLEFVKLDFSKEIIPQICDFLYQKILMLLQHVLGFQ